MEKMNILIERGNPYIQLIEDILDPESPEQFTIFVTFIYQKIHVTAYSRDVLDAAERRKVCRELLRLTRLKSDSSAYKSHWLNRAEPTPSISSII